MLSHPGQAYREYSTMPQLADAERAGLPIDRDRPLADAARHLEATEDAELRAAPHEFTDPSASIWQ